MCFQRSFVYFCEMVDHKTIFSIKSEEEFNKIALEIFKFQVSNCDVYGQFVQDIVEVSKVRHYTEIPCLPIALFKTALIYCGKTSPMLRFESSGTTSQTPSVHLVADAGLYKDSFVRGFNRVFGAPSDYAILALLPSYLERQHSSLVYMMQELITQSAHPQSGFYLHELEELSNALMELEAKKQPVLLLGVSYALLDLCEKITTPLQHTTIVETGGMKGRREEMVKEELYHILKKGLGVRDIASEYGMTELLSQAWSLREAIYDTPP